MNVVMKAPGLCGVRQRPRLPGKTSVEAQTDRWLRRLSASSIEYANFLFELGAQMITLNLEIVPRLQIEPEAIARAKVPGQAEGLVCGDGSRAVHNLVNPPRRHTDVLGQAIL